MQLTLKELISSLTWTEVEEHLIDIYPEESDLLNYYKRLFWELSNSEALPNETNAMLYLELFDEEDDEEYYEYENFVDEPFDYEQMLLTWKNFLGFYIDPELLRSLERAEIMAHFFVEFTYGGFDEVFED